MCVRAESTRRKYSVFTIMLQREQVALGSHCVLFCIFRKDLVVQILVPGSVVIVLLFDVVKLTKGKTKEKETHR